MKPSKQRELCAKCVWGTLISNKLVKCMFGACVMQTDTDEREFTDRITGDIRET